MRKQYRNSNYYDSEDRNEPKINSGSIMKYIFLTIVFSLVIYGVNTAVMNGIKLSPILKVGNGIISLYEIHNYGAAFNLFKGQTDALIVFAVVAVICMFLFICKCSKKLSHNAISSMALLSSGIIMNMYERIVHNYVIDYIHLDFAPNAPMFNTADILIVCGVFGILLYLVKRD